MLAAIEQLFSPPVAKYRAYDAYAHIVAQARRPVFYRDWQVEDTLDGRFDVIVLHMFLVVSRCEEDEDFVRYLSEAFFSDMDRNLREMGASDTGVGIKVKKMAQAFYGRLKAYKETIGNDVELSEALRRNAYREKPVSDESVASLAAYMRRNHQALQSQPVTALMQGNINFSG